MKLYKFYGPEFGRINLEQRRLKISRLAELNDPFEFHPFRIDTKEERVEWKRMRDNLWAKKGIISFSERNSNPVMWAHYAENHSGLALGFDVSDASRVNYVGVRRIAPSLSSVVDQHDAASIKEALLTKYWHWRYESEWRVFVQIEDEPDEKGLSFYPFDGHLMLRSVHIGCRSEIKVDDIERIVGDSVEVALMRPAFKSFSVVPIR